MAQNSSLNSLRPPCLCRVHYRTQGQADEKQGWGRTDQTSSVYTKRNWIILSTAKSRDVVSYLLAQIFHVSAYLCLQIYIYFSLPLPALSGYGKDTAGDQNALHLVFRAFWLDWLDSEFSPTPRQCAGMCGYTEIFMLQWLSFFLTKTSLWLFWDPVLLRSLH